MSSFLPKFTQRIALISFFFLLAISSAHAQVINLSSFGAIPDDGVDDAPALQMALDQLALDGGGDIRFPAGQIDILSPVVKNFFNEASSIMLSGYGAKSRVRIAVGRSQTGIRLLSLESLLIEKITFHGTPTQNQNDPEFVDAVYALDFTSCDRIMVRDCDFYGLASNAAAGAVLHAENSDLTIENSSFKGCLGSFWTPDRDGSVVRVDSWRGLTVRRTDFIDYGTLNGVYYSKTSAFVGAWIYTGGGQGLNAIGQRRIVIEDVRMDEGAAKGLFVAGGAQWVNIKGLNCNVNNGAVSAGIWLNGVKNARIEQSWFGYAQNDRPAIQISDSDYITLDGLVFSEAVSHVWIISATRNVILRNSEIPANPAYPNGFRNQGGATIQVVN